MERAGHFGRHSGEKLDRDQRGEIADGPGQRAEHAEFGAIVAIVGVECIADEAAVAWARPEQGDLALELLRGGAEQGDAEVDAGVADQQPSGEIVGAVDD